MRNVGFVKVECDYEVCTVHIHGKGLRMGENRKLALYLFYEENGQCIGILQGETKNVNPAVNYRLRFTPADTGEAANFERIKGVILESARGDKYAAVWDDMPVDVNHMILWKPSEESVLQDAVDEKCPSCGNLSPEKMDIVENDMAEKSLEKEADSVVEENEREVAQPEQETELPEDSITNIRMQIEEIHAEKMEKAMHPWKVSKIQRKDLVKLPRCEWKLSNNSFLLHGYYNYHHLVMINDGNVWKIGVPGIYHANEEKAAAAFGFFEFVPRNEVDIVLEEDEDSREEQFGYWCRRVRR